MTRGETSGLGLSPSAFPSCWYACTHWSEMGNGLEIADTVFEWQAIPIMSLISIYLWTKSEF